MSPRTTHRVGIFVLSLVAALAAAGLVLGHAGAPDATAASGSGTAAGLAAPDNEIWHQDVADVEGGVEVDDHFGSALAAGDFNGDGALDVAIGVPDEDVEGVASAGAVNVLYGSGTGLTAAGDRIWHQNVAGVEGGAEASDFFGRALAAGDFNNDGRDDLAIGVPFEDVGVANTGAVNVLYGSAGGLAADGDQVWHQDVADLEGVAEASDGFGSALATGDFNDDGRDDLAIGVPFEAVGAVSTAGAVNVLYGSAGGLTVAGDQIWHQESADIEGVAETGDRFGLALAAGDFGGGGSFEDLAIGVPFDSIDTAAGAGAVNVLYGSVGGLSAVGNQVWHQDVADVEGVAEEADHFGRALAAGDFSDDGRPELAIGVPGEGVDGTRNAGAVNVLYSSPAGLTVVGDQIWHQDVNGVEGVAEANDAFGSALTSGDFDGNGSDDLAVGAPTDSESGADGAGAVNVLYAESGFLSRNGNQIWHQDVPGMEGEAEASDLFGDALAAGDFNDDGPDDLAIGVPGEGVDGVTGAGAVSVIYSGEPATPTPTDTPPAEATPTDTPPAEATPTNTPPVGATPTNTPQPPTPTRTPTPQAGLPGDANCDGSVNPIDATVILQLTAGLIGSVGCPENADVNEDGQINSLDAALILQFVAGLIGSL